MPLMKATSAAEKVMPFVSAVPSGRPGAPGRTTGGVDCAAAGPEAVSRIVKNRTKSRRTKLQEGYTRTGRAFALTDSPVGSPARDPAEGQADDARESDARRFSRAPETGRKYSRSGHS